MFHTVCIGTTRLKLQTVKNKSRLRTFWGSSGEAGVKKVGPGINSWRFVFCYHQNQNFKYNNMSKIQGQNIWVNKLWRHIYCLLFYGLSLLSWGVAITIKLFCCSTLLCPISDIQTKPYARLSFLLAMTRHKF